MKIKLFLISLTALLLSSCFSITTITLDSTISTTKPSTWANKRLNDIYNDLIAIDIDKVAFEKDDLLRIYETSGTTIGYYSIIENPNNNFNGLLLYSTDQVELYKLIPTIEGNSIIINIKSTEGITSKITIKKENKSSYSRILPMYICDVNIAEYPNLSLDVSGVTKASIMSKYVTSYTKYIFNKNDELIFAKEVLSNGIDNVTTNNYSTQTNIDAEPNLISLLLLSTKIIEEIIASQNAALMLNAVQIQNGSTFPNRNTNGTINYNGNPTDSF
ncbi:hypothetical protein [Spirochaeta cellobiosiphila]|uniref:hypothetical protein n=1 Tax=Spirochaeta cellobiosiphila TaxID=504483 RepID=UPI000405B731|nr:hypothetical protein [Spirochaeta cellobiosiphila]